MFPSGQQSQWESLDLNLGVTALSLLQQPEKLQWEVVASVLEDTVKDLEELGANPPLNQAKASSQGKAKDKVADHHTIPFPCLLVGGLLSYCSPSGTPAAGPSASATTAAGACRTTDAAPRTQAAEPYHPGHDQGPMEIESCSQNVDLAGSQLQSPSGLVASRRTIPVLLLYSVKDVDDKSSGQVFAQMNNLMSKGLHEEGFTVPQIIEMEFDTHEQLLLQDPPITYIQQFADAATNLAGLDSHADKWSTLAAAATVSAPPRPGALVQCLRLPRRLEEENLYVDSLTPCWDGVHLLACLQPCGAEPPSAANQVEALNNLNRLHSALCSQRKGDAGPPPQVANGVEGHHQSGAALQTPLILPPADQQQQQQKPSTGSNGGYLALYKLNYSTRIVTLDEEPVKVQQIRDPMDAITSLILLPPDVLDTREDDSEEAPEEALPSASKSSSSRFGLASAAAAAGTAGGTAATSSSGAANTSSPSSGSHKEAKQLDVSGLGHLVVTTRAGYIMIMDLSTLEVLAKVEPPKKEGLTEETDPFVSVTFCSGTDRLCACTEGE